jgi:signal transduction histidine kinase
VAGRFAYVREVRRPQWRFQRLRSVHPLTVDAALAVAFAVVGVATALGEDIRDDRGALRDGFREPGPGFVVVVVLICAPIAFRRRVPLLALVVSALAIMVTIVVGWPEGTLPLAGLLLAATVGARCPIRRAVVGMVAVIAVIVVIGLSDAPAIDTVGTFAVLAQSAAAWAIGIAFRNRRVAATAMIREADERAEAERERAARLLAEERLRIAQELHDVVAHSMSVIAVQAGAGAHVLERRPEQALVALEAISATSRGTLSEMRRLLGALRDSDGARPALPEPGIGDLANLVDEVRAAGVPVTLRVDGTPDCVHAGVGLAAYRVVQEALTNVIKHANAPSRVDVTVRHMPGSLTVEVLDDGRGGAGPGDSRPADGSGHGLVGMRERVALWAGELSVGPVPSGGFRVEATFPQGDRG